MALHFDKAALCDWMPLRHNLEDYAVLSTRFWNTIYSNRQLTRKSALLETKESIPDHLATSNTQRESLNKPVVILQFAIWMLVTSQGSHGEEM